MPTKRRPNILHLFTDMQRADTIAALGNPVIRTPHLDRLVHEGTAFVNAFSPSPVCVAARCAMIHGQYPAQTGCYENTLMPTDGRQTFMDALSRTGYRTHGIGKCHFTPDALALRGFQTREVQEEGTTKADLSRLDYLAYLKANGLDYISEPYGVRSEMYYIPQLAQMPAEHHPTTWIGDRSRAFIDDQRATNGHQPWYLYSSFIHPHPPFAPPTPWHKIYRTADMPLPVGADAGASLLTWINRVQNRYKYRDQGVDANLVRTIKAYYYACISYIDFQIGGILATLEQTGELDNTLILFSSDHGEYLGDYGCWGKRAMHDASARVPLVVRLPQRFAAGRVVKRPASLVDIAPTFLAAAGATVDSHRLSGVDLAALADGSVDRSVVFGQLAFDNSLGSGMMTPAVRAADALITDRRRRIAAHSVYMAVSEDAKYVYSAPDAREYLFDRVRDPQELRNRVGAPFYAPATAELKRRLVAWLHETGETAGLTSGGAGGVAGGSASRSTGGAAAVEPDVASYGSAAGNDNAFAVFPQLDVTENPDQGLLVQDLYTPWTKIDLPGYHDAGSGAT